MYENHLATQAFCYLLDFVYQHNPHLVNKISEPILENCSDRLILANHSLKQLNILEDGNQTNRFSSVAKMLNLCTTPMGKRKFAHDLLNPTTNIPRLKREYNITEHMMVHYNNNNNSNNKHFELLKEFKDLSKFKRQITMKKLSPAQLYYLRNNLKTAQDMIQVFSLDEALITYFEETGAPTFSALHQSCNSISTYLDERLIWDECKTLDDIRDVERNFMIKGTNKELDKVNQELLESKDKLDAVLNYLNSLVGLAEKKMKDGYVKYHETEKSNISLVATKRRAAVLKKQIEQANKKGGIIPLDFTSSYSGAKSSFQFKCTVDELELTNQNASNSFISCPMIDKLGEDIAKAKAGMKGILIAAFFQIVGHLDTVFQQQLEDISQFITAIDVLHCKMTIAKKYNYCKPEIDDRQKSFFEAEDLRHCIIEQIQQSELYVANSVKLGQGTSQGTSQGTGKGTSQGTGQNGILLYGTNAVGKTSVIKSVGIAVIMAQAGLYVPARVFKFKPYKYIFTRILGNDNLFKGLSTFAVEMYELRTILRLANQDSLVLGDELCSGTESTSAISIFVAGIEWLQKSGSSFLFATHLHEITGYEEITDLGAVKQMHMQVLYDKENDALIYDRKLRDGPGTSSYGLEVCKSLQLPSAFLDRAHEIRMKYRPEQANVLSLNTSHYNSKKVMGLCEKCKTVMGQEVHHLQPQREANEDGMI
jgi:DNA mismatch repair protein MutS